MVRLKLSHLINNSSKGFYLVTMSNPWAEVYKNLRLEILNESDLQERRKLHNVKTAATQTRYDLKSRVAKMRAQGKTDLEIKQYLDKYISNSQLPGEQKAQIRQVALSSGYEPEGQLVEESERVLVRITTEDGRVFEKKVPREKIVDLRKRYKTVVEVGSSEKAPIQTSNKSGGVNEGEHVKRWWDDDGDGKGYEDDEVNGKFKKKKKKKVRSESLSDWRYEIQIDENQIGLTPKEMRSSENGGEKKK